MSKEKWGPFEALMAPVNMILDSDLEELRRRDEVKRVESWNQLEHNQNVFEDDFAACLPRDIMLNGRSKFAFAKLLLAAAAHVNREESSIVERFNSKELTLVESFEKFSAFDILSPKEIAERIARRGDIYDLVMEFYKGQYSDLDRLFDDPDVPKDLKYAFSHRYGKRLEKIKKGVQEYVGQYGPTIVVSQIEEKVWSRIKESEEERRHISESLRLRIADVTSKLKTRDEVDRENQSFANRLREVEQKALGGREPSTLNALESQGGQLVQRYLGFETEIDGLVAVVDRKHQELVAREAELERARQEYEQQKEEQRRKLVESELREVEALKSQLESEARSLQEEKTSLQLKREEINDRLTRLTDVSEGKSLRFVTKEDAKLCELNFIARFDRKMHDFPVNVFSPVENRTFAVNSWEQDSHRRMSENVASPTSPANESSQYAIFERKYIVFGEKVTKAIIEAVSFGDLSTFEEYGFNTGRATKSQYLQLVLPRKNRAEVGKYLHVIGIASPTGWDETLAKELSSESFAKNYLSQNVSVCLVDSLTGEICYNSLDKRMAEFAERFRPEFEEERIKGLRTKALEKLTVSGFIVPEDFAKETGEAHTTVLKVLYDLEREGKARARVSKDIGLIFEGKN
jgi:hypothetical protein